MILIAATEGAVPEICDVAVPKSGLESIDCCLGGRRAGWFGFPWVRARDYHLWT